MKRAYLIDARGCFYDGQNKARSASWCWGSGQDWDFRYEAPSAGYALFSFWLGADAEEFV